MAMVTIQEAQAKLPDLIHKLMPGDEVVITENNVPVARLLASPLEKARPVPGRVKGMLTILAEDDEHLEDFREYITTVRLTFLVFDATYTAAMI